MAHGELADWIAAIVAGLALVVSCCSAILSVRSLRWERLSAEAAGRSAEAAERSNRLTERALEIRSGQVQDVVSAGDDAETVPDVRWRIEHPQGSRYVLRNIGTGLAEHVEVDPEQAPRIHRNLPSDAVIRPGEGHDMLLKGSMQSPMPNQLYVRWGGQADWVAVPLSDA